MAGRELFTSQLSVSGFALCEPAGVVPLRQVVGNCVFSLGGVNSVRAYEHLYGFGIGRPEHQQARGVELTGVSAWFNDARSHALERLLSEATACGAHAVLDVRVQREHSDTQAQSVVEYLVTGTAVRVTGAPIPAKPALAAVPVDDYWKLMQAGYEPFGIAAATVVYQTRPSISATRTLAGLRYREGRETREVPEFSATVSGAIEIAMARLGESAQRFHASHVVGVQIERTIEAVNEDNTGRMPLAHEPSKRKHLRATVHVLGSAIRDRTGSRPGLERTERGTWRDVLAASGRDASAIDAVIGLGPAPRLPIEPEVTRGEQA